MDASAWIALASLAGFVLVQTGVALFALGGLFRDVRSLRDGASQSDCKAELAVLTSQFNTMQETLKEVAHDVRNLLTGKIVPARRSVSND